MKELVLVRSTPAELQFNFEEFRESVRAELKKYDLVVTTDTLKDSKKLAADLNKVAAKIKNDFKEASALVTKPIDDIGAQVMSLVAEVLESYENLKAQNKKFEDERKVIVRGVLFATLSSEWDKQGVFDVFKCASIDGLVKLTAITATDKPTSASLQAIATMVAQDKSLQDQTEKRLLTLENQSYRAGLKAPLTRAHVESFLFSSEEIYQQNLDSMIASEIQRQEVAEQAMRATIEKEQAVQVVEVVAQEEPVQEEVVHQKPQPQPEPQAAPDPDQARITHINSMTGRELMNLGLTKDQAVKVMEMAYNGELHGLRMVY